MGRKVPVEPYQTFTQWMKSKQVESFGATYKEGIGTGLEPEEIFDKWEAFEETYRMECKENLWIPNFDDTDYVWVFCPECEQFTIAQKAEELVCPVCEEVIPEEEEVDEEDLTAKNVIKYCQGNCENCKNGVKENGPTITED